MIGVTIGVGRWRQTAELAAEAARRHTGLNAIVLDDSVWRDFKDVYSYPGFLKLHVFDFVDDDDVLIFDADAIHINSWNPTELSGRRAVVGVPDAFIGGLAAEARVDARDYINAGVMVLNRRHHEPLLRAARALHDRDERPAHREQALINKVRASMGIPLHALDFRYNHLRFFADPTFDPSRTVIAHWTPHGADPSPIEAFCKCSPVLSVGNANAVASEFVSAIPEYPGGYGGRGIVVCAGGVNYLTCAWVAIRRLRELGCKLPIQVWYRGDDEFDRTWARLAGDYGVECIDAEKVREEHPHPNLGGWELKPYAMLHSPFRDVLSLDADNVPVRDPTFLFEAPEYCSTGAVFWPDLDITRTPADSPRWKIFGVEFREEPEFESGQMLIDKARCWRPLQLCNWYNERSHFYYNYIYGDKDSFRFAWRRLNQPFAMPPSPLLQPPTFVQHDFAGQRLFQHRAQVKWSLLDNSPAPHFVHEDRCFDHLRELRNAWNPWASRLPSPNGSRSAGPSHALIQQTGKTSRSIELLNNGLVVGASGDATLWWTEGKELVFADREGRRVTTLKRRAPKCWAGPVSHGSRSMMRVRLLASPPPVVHTNRGEHANLPNWLQPYRECFREPLYSLDVRHVALLREIVDVAGFKRILEIGCFNGASTAAFLTALDAGSDFALHLCDTQFRPALRGAIANCRISERITLHERSSLDVIDDSFDFIFVDGDHSLPHVTEEVRLLLAHRIPTIVAHDTRSTDAGIPDCEGAALLGETFRHNHDYQWCEDAKHRIGEATHRGLFFCTRRADVFERVAPLFDGLQ